MPFGDGTGPSGRGPGSGRGRGQGRGQGSRWRWTNGQDGRQKFWTRRRLLLSVLRDKGPSSTGRPLLRTELPQLRQQDGKGITKGKSSEGSVKMPIYEYRCEDCGKISEIFVQGRDALACPICGGKNLTRLLSIPSMVGVKDTASKTTCCGRTERCDTPPCSNDGSCKR